LSEPASETQITHRSRLWLYLIAATILAFLVLPTIIVIPMSFSSAKALTFPPPGFSLRWYEAFFHNPQWMEAMWRRIDVPNVRS